MEKQSNAKVPTKWEYCDFCGVMIPLEEYDFNDGLCDECLNEQETE